MYQSWREEDLEAAMTSSSGYPRDFFGTDALWDTESFGIKRATKGPAPKKPRTEFHPVTKNALKTITRQKMYQNWREKDSEALMTSSSRYPPDFEVSPTRNSVSPYAPIIHQYSTYEHQYLSQNDSWTAFSSATNYNSDVPNFKQNPAPY
ncbi:hypothetical protein L3Y34_019218 [Caenorhabditis briggsae]|uniref:Uncharacterized protein n=1 Tax=Caenorhabditis briggsae TaxID=6238 RepID=A0AAE9IVP4_CAEBR|nr:hypothetical protein L3Y34_019218 [Caenorhabditis briggsae]